MIPDRLLQNGQGTLTDLVLLESTELCLVKFRFGDVDVLTVSKDEKETQQVVEQRSTDLMVGGGGDARREDNSHRARVPHEGAHCCQKVWWAPPDWSLQPLSLPPSAARILPDYDMGRLKQKGKAGAAKAYVTRSAAIKKLQCSLADFRRLCILKGTLREDNLALLEF